MSSEAKKQIQDIMNNPSKKGLQKQLKKSLGFLKSDPKYPSLNSHPIGEIDGLKVWTSYVQNRTPQAYRILWTYGNTKNTIYLLQVIPHY
jgi:hypothetical protein